MLRLLIPAALALTAGAVATLIHPRDAAHGPAAIELAPGNVAAQPAAEPAPAPAPAQPQGQ